MVVELIGHYDAAQTLMHLNSNWVSTLARRAMLESSVWLN
jgi:hypothetical protein